jgi:hypothetical protein
VTPTAPRMAVVCADRCQFFQGLAKLAAQRRSQLPHRSLVSQGLPLGTPSLEPKCKTGGCRSIPYLRICDYEEQVVCPPTRCRIFANKQTRLTLIVKALAGNSHFTAISPNRFSPPRSTVIVTGPFCCKRGDLRMLGQAPRLSHARAN